MENNQVALSQAEVDKLLGLSSGDRSDSVVKKEKKSYKVKEFLTPEQLEEVRGVCKSVYKHFKLDLRGKFGEPKIRKLTISSLEQININEFFDTITDNDFLYEVSFGELKAFIKLDSFLFGALSGMNIDTKHKINFFQSEVLKEFVVNFLAGSFARQFSDKFEPVVTSLFEKDKKTFRTGKTGLNITINWNENLRSFGIEKVFLTQEAVESFRVLSK
ncbi:MAG: hypothetical protein IJ207_10665 [Treponema sp.]|uniref:hypothetical protein n=1 Tax=Treponema sp. TaxID=166 RepID=UPI0025E8F186|nr:hypothetical protein [Treponema sp.]MBQ9282635.1 hypothetical protein [Treponema sp.]